MTIFGIRIMRESTYKAELLAAHTEEWDDHQAHIRSLLRDRDTLDMQRDWWRLQYETLLARPRTIRITRTGDLHRLGDGIKIEVDPT